MLPPRYLAPARVGGGGMADVYQATDAKLDRVVAVKLLREPVAADPALRQRFTREALAAGRLSGAPHTITVYDVGEWQGRPYLVMEYLPGGSLEHLLRRDGVPSRAQALALLGQAAAALDHAHAHGVVHRDVKPANLLLDRDRSVKVADFGIASATGLAALTQPGTVLGTAGYLAPEQAEGKPATAAADRYALAVLAFELLTGERPFQRSSPTAEASAHLTAPVPRASTRNSELPSQVDRVFERALAKQPGARFPSCTAFAQALAATLDQEEPTRMLLPDGRPRHRRLALLAAAAAAAAGAALVMLLPSGHGHTAAMPPTTTAAAAQTVTATTTATTTSTQTPTATTVAAPPDPSSQAQQLLQQGNYQAALPLLLQLTQQLQGTDTAAEANADYELAYTITQLGSCDGVLPLLDRAQTIQGPQPQLDQLRALCTAPPGHRPGHGHGHDGGDN